MPSHASRSTSRVRIRSPRRETRSSTPSSGCRLAAKRGRPYPPGRLDDLHHVVRRHRQPEALLAQPRRRCNVDAPGSLQAIVPIAMLAFVLSSMLGDGPRSDGLARSSRRFATLASWSGRSGRTSSCCPLAAIGAGSADAARRAVRRSGLLLLARRPARRSSRSWRSSPGATSRFAVGLMVLLMVITIGYLPLALPLMLPG